LRLAALTLLKQLVCQALSVGALADFLPGIVSAMVKIIVGDFKQGILYARVFKWAFVCCYV
jgi:hypothetical protein